MASRIPYSKTLRKRYRISISTLIAYLKACAYADQERKDNPQPSKLRFHDTPVLDLSG